MIPIPNPIPEPTEFNINCRIPGNRWLNTHGNKNEGCPSLWRKFNSALQDGFESRCGFLGQHITSGTIDHFKSKKDNPSLIYEWSNYRFVEGWINSAKGSKSHTLIMDPFLVEKGWFEIILPSLQLVVSDRIPIQYRSLAESTLKNLPIRDDERAIKSRQSWLSAYRSGHLTLLGLKKYAPLIARAIIKEKAELRRQRRNGEN